MPFKTSVITACFLFSLTCLISCGNKSTKNNKAATVADIIKPSPVDTPATNEIKLVCKELPKDSFDIPYYNVFLSVNGKETFIRKVNSCNEITRDEYTQHQIPAEAVMAKGGWYAGGGDYFYLVIRDGKPIVYEGWQEETQEDNGYHWEVKKFN